MGRPMKFAYFDPKTGKPLFDAVEGAFEQRYKQSNHSFLEHWLDTHGLSKTDFGVGAAYQSDRASEMDTTLEQQRLEAEGKYLVFTNGKDGYFTHQAMATLMSEGDASRGIGPIFANDRDSPHNFVAYGSLVASDGVSATALRSGNGPSAVGGEGSMSSPVRILVIDDEHRSHGDEPLVDRRGHELSFDEVSMLYDKMGDGTMLVSKAVMLALVSNGEREQLMAQAMKTVGVSETIADLSDTHLVDQAVAEGERRIEQFAHRLVSQFRAASTDPDLPGMAKGTMQMSQWAERLGVEAIISANDIKGDDGRFSAPGIKAVSDFWINRKVDAQYGTQVVGPQVKGTIPEATLHEFNPKMKAKAEQLASVARDPKQLLAYYVEKKEGQHRLQAEDGLGDCPDWIYDTAKADRHGQLEGFSKLNRALEQFLRRERVDVATHGIAIPSAMAQHHGQLKPWEVANKDLPQDAIVTYYRSPFPNVGAAAIAINNPAAIRAADPEAYRKHGVAYLNPWTAKAVAITDFDSDANGFFVGYEASEPGLADWMREQLADTEALPLAEQYEAGRSLVARLIHQAEHSADRAMIRPVEEGYPMAVKEFVERNAPERKPAEVRKQPKIKHPWENQESRQHALYRAWQVTANNPTGKVANAGMTLQSLAAQTHYTPPDQQEALVQRISQHFQGVLKEVNAGTLSLPSNAELDAQGFPPYHLKGRVQSLANAGRELSTTRDPQQRQALIEETLQETHALLIDIVEGPNAVNLQTAVDVAKSARGIDEAIHRIARRFAYQEDDLREHHKDHTLYTNGQSMPTNIDDPINWAVRDANAVYEDSQLKEWPNETFKEIFPKGYTLEQQRKAIPLAKKYNELNRQAAAARDRLHHKADRDAQPTLTVTIPDGRQLEVENILESDPAQTLPIWRTHADQRPGDKIILQTVLSTAGSSHKPTINAFLEREGQCYDLCPISPESIKIHQLDQRMANGRGLVIPHPTLTINPAYAIQNDADLLFERAADYLDEAIHAIPDDERMAYASAMWRDSHAMGPVLKKMIPELSTRLLQPIPPMTITGIGYYEQAHGLFPSDLYTVRFDQMHYDTQKGMKVSPSVVLLGEDGSEYPLGTLNPRNVRPRQGTVAIADIQRNPQGKTATLTIQQLQTADGWVKNGEPATETRDDSLKHQEIDDSTRLYQPTAQELRTWLRAAQGNPTKVEAITQQGLRLKQTWPQGPMPGSHRHPSVLLEPEQTAQMQRDIAIYQQQRRSLPPQHQALAER